MNFTRVAVLVSFLALSAGRLAHSQGAHANAQTNCDQGCSTIFDHVTGETIGYACRIGAGSAWDCGATASGCVTTTCSPTQCCSVAIVASSDGFVVAAARRCDLAEIQEQVRQVELPGAAEWEATSWSS